MEFWIDLSELLRNLALACAAGVGGYLAWLRLRPEVTQAELARRAHVTELFNRAATQLNDDQLEIRLAAIYVLREVGQDFPDLANPAFELLQAHLRQRKTEMDNDRMPADIEAIMRTLYARMK